MFKIEAPKKSDRKREAVAARIEDPDVMKWVKARAKTTGTTQSDIVTQACKYAMKDESPSTGIDSK